MFAYSVQTFISPPHPNKNIQCYIEIMSINALIKEVTTSLTTLSISLKVDTQKKDNKRVCRKPVQYMRQYNNNNMLSMILAPVVVN